MLIPEVMVAEIVQAALLGLLVGVVIGVIATLAKPGLERRRWKAIWENERWLKDLQDFHAKLEDRVEALEVTNRPGDLPLFPEMEEEDQE